MNYLAKSHSKTSEINNKSLSTVFYGSVNTRIILIGYNIIEMNNIVIKLAFEYNGPQHYIFPNQFHNNTPEGYKQFLDQKKRDMKKRLLSKEKINNIILIEFPYYIDKNMNHPHIIQGFIVKEFESKTKIKLPLLPQFDHRNDNIRQKKNNQLRLDKFSSELD